MADIPCVCPPKTDGTPRHPNGDRVKLREKLDFRSALQARNVVLVIKQEDPEADAAEILAGLTEVYLLIGIESWTLMDERGKAVPVSRQAVRAFMAEHPDEAMTIGDEADALYNEAVIVPLVKRASQGSTSSQPTQTDASTSATNGPSSAPRKPSKRSLTTTTRTDATATMSARPGGDYN